MELKVKNLKPGGGPGDEKKGLEDLLQALAVSGAPGTIRTCDLRIRSPFFYISRHFLEFP